jgi:hypothetical protein
MSGLSETSPPGPDGQRSRPRQSRDSLSLLAPGQAGKAKLGEVGVESGMASRRRSLEGTALGTRRGHAGLLPPWKDRTGRDKG